MHWINFLFFAQSLCSWSLGFKQEIISPREVMSVGYKEDVEAELSYLTERHGFVDDENVQHSGAYEDPETGKVSYLNPAEKFLHEFVSKYLRGNNAYDTPITEEYFEDVDLSMRLCPTYLRDPIYDYNDIHPNLDARKHARLYELKFVEFQYFTRRTELVKVVRCPVMVGNFLTRLYFLEIHHFWNFSGPLRGYFVFINKVVPMDATSQPLQLLMYVDPDPSEFLEMNTAGREATLRNSLDRVSSRTMKIRLKPVKPFLNPFEVSTATTMRERMDAQNTYTHYFGEEAEIMLLSKFYGFVDFPRRHIRPWRMKKMLLILDRMAKNYVISRERIDAVRRMEPEKSCRNYMSLNDELKRRQILPRENLHGARYVTKTVNFRQFEYLGGMREQELLKCPIIYRRRGDPRSIYLQPIHYENPHKLPQLFSFFDDPNDRTKVNVFILSPVPSFVDDVDFNVTDQNLVDPTEVPSTSYSHHPEAVSDSEIPEQISADLSTMSLHSGPEDPYTASLYTGPEGLYTSYLPPGYPYSYPNYPSAFPVYSDPGSFFTGTEYLQTDPFLAEPDYPPRSPVESDTASISYQEDSDTAPLLTRQD